MQRILEELNILGEEQSISDYLIDKYHEYKDDDRQRHWIVFLGLSFEEFRNKVNLKSEPLASELMQAVLDDTPSQYRSTIRNFALLSLRADLQALSPNESLLTDEEKEQVRQCRVNANAEQIRFLLWNHDKRFSLLKFLATLDSVEKTIMTEDEVVSLHKFISLEVMCPFEIQSIEQFILEMGKSDSKLFTLYEWKDLDKVQNETDCRMNDYLRRFSIQSKHYQVSKMRNELYANTALCSYYAPDDEDDILIAACNDLNVAQRQGTLRQKILDARPEKVGKLETSDGMTSKYARIIAIVARIIRFIQSVEVSENVHWFSEDHFQLMKRRIASYKKKIQPDEKTEVALFEIENYENEMGSGEKITRAQFDHYHGQLKRYVREQFRQRKGLQVIQYPFSHNPYEKDISRETLDRAKRIKARKRSFYEYLGQLWNKTVQSTKRIFNGGDNRTRRLK
jgi:hypothetical protein